MAKVVKVLYDDDNVPYDPDMTVTEALEDGLIVVLDQQTIGRTYTEPCDYGGPYREVPVRCTRKKGHKGVHAFVMRWEESADDYDKRVREEQREREEALRALENKTFRGPMKGIPEQLADISEQAARVAEQIGKMDVPKQSDILKELHKHDSMTYGPNAKHLQYKDQNVGKVRRR